MSMEWIFICIFLSFFFTSAILWFVFSYGIVPRIDERMAEAGKSRACPTDIMGLRVLMIATAISLPIGNFLNHDGNPLIKASELRPHASSSDKLLALVLTVTSYSWVVLALIGSFFIPET